MKMQSVNIGRTLAWVAFVAYLVAMALEAWRPGFVTFFWNPQLLLIFAIIGVILGAWGEPARRKRWLTLAFFFALAIVSAIAIWQSFPPSGSRFLVTIATLLLIVSAGFLFKKHS